MLRDRLKQTRAHLTTPAVPVPTPGDDHPSHSSNVGVDRDLVALKNKYNQAQGDAASARQSQALGQRKRKANLPADQDADLDVHALKSRERAGGEDIDEVFRDNILRLGERYKGTEMGGKGAFGNGDKAGMDEEGEIDMKMFLRKEQSQADALQKEAQRAMKSQQQLRKVVESCRRCTESRTFLRAALISAGENAVLRVKIDPDALVEGHLEIVPVSHVSSILQCDEETQKEIERFQSCLRRMYEAQGKGVLFIETAVHFHSRPHALIDVIPIERGMEDEASMFFKEVSSALCFCCRQTLGLCVLFCPCQRSRPLRMILLMTMIHLHIPQPDVQAFFSCDEEWAQHKKIIDLSRARPLKRAVPTHFQYMAAEWGDPDGGSKDKGGMAPYGGIAHPVESEHTIDTNFCLDVVAGMLDLEPLRMRRAVNKGRPAGEATALGTRMEKVVVDFKAEWSAFDWTQYL
jgi:diadenosine tetraphosphate (Ap4A) HIT family hydrolase